MLGSSPRISLESRCCGISREKGSTLPNFPGPCRPCSCCRCPRVVKRHPVAFYSLCLNDSIRTCTWCPRSNSRWGLKVWILLYISSLFEFQSLVAINDCGKSSLWETTWENMSLDVKDMAYQCQYGLLYAITPFYSRAFPLWWMLLKIIPRSGQPFHE